MRVDSTYDFARWHSFALDRRLSVLAALAAKWRPISPDQEVPQRVSLPDFIPQALRDFYGIVSDHGTDAFVSNFGGWTGGTPVVTFHWLRRPDSLFIDDSGIVPFLNENQGVYQCGVKLTDSDPNVVTCEVEQSEWELQADRLSDFLFVLLAFEFSSQSDYGAFGTQMPQELPGSLIRVDFPNVAWFGRRPVSTLHGDGVILLAIPNTDGTAYVQAGARTQDELEALRGFGAWEYGFG